MAFQNAAHEQGHETHFWIDCAGCGYGGKIGVPAEYPADVVVCPKCRQVVRVRPEDRILWQPADATELRRRRFPGVDWEAAAAEAEMEVVAHDGASADTSPKGERAERSELSRSREGRSPRGAPRARFGSVSRPIVWPDQESLLDSAWVQGTFIIAVGLFPLVLVLALTQPSRPALDASAEQSAEPPALDTVAKTSPCRAGPNSATRMKPPDKNKPAQPEGSAAKPSPAIVYRRAKKRLAKGEYEGAVCDFDNVLRRKPEFVWCYYYRAGAYSLTGNQSAAMNDLDVAAAAMPAEARVWRARAVVHHRMHNLIAAVADIRRAVELVDGSTGSRDAEFVKAVSAKAVKLLDELFEHATAMLKAGDCPTAIEEFSEVLRQKPDNASAWLRRALAYDADCQFDKALDDLNVALRLRPGPAQAFELRSVLQERKQDYAAALADMRTAQKLDPDRADYGERVRWLLRQQEAQQSQQLAARWRMR